ncbi:MAG TPA: phosphate signaling complex protein PhoU, partial [Steroidobacteraceae bacterium]|nr:phosphate signaling complex protein PhoU [Steroidobacteraceae bacterium]
MSGIVHSDPVEGHTAKALDTALTEVRLHAVSLGGLVIDQVSMAMRSLLEGDRALADVVIEREDRVNQLERSVDHEAFAFMARYQPMAGDLRLIKAIWRIAVELERAGDEAKKIARFAVRVSGGEPFGPVVAASRYLRHMASLSALMLRNAVRALDETNTVLAQDVAVRDRELDEEFQSGLRQVLTLVMEGEPY